MIKVSIMYPQNAGTRFDHTYYRDNHMPLIKRRMGAGLKYYTVDKAVSGTVPGSAAPFIAMCHLICDSLETYQSSFAPYAEEITADIRKFTDRTPVTQISEVIVENSANAWEAHDALAR